MGWMPFGSCVVLNPSLDKRIKGVLRACYPLSTLISWDSVLLGAVQKCNGDNILILVLVSPRLGERSGEGQTKGMFLRLISLF